jgi:hypothetical protein
MARTALTTLALRPGLVGDATASSYPTTAKHLWDGREAIRAAIRL